MRMTLEEYIKNPMGKNNAVFSQRELFKDIYTKKFDALLAREAGTINYHLYKDNEKRYVAHFKIPSETVEKFYYDVVLEFIAPNAEIAEEPTLKNYEVHFYSNDPAFVYTYAYVFAKHKIFIEDLKPKMSKIALTQSAGIKNPQNVVGYVKTIYFSYLFIKLRGLDKKAAWAGSYTSYNPKDLLNFVEDADKKIELRRIKGEEKEQKERSKSSSSAKTILNNLGSKVTSAINKTKTTPTTTSKKVKTTTRTKRK